MPGFSQMSGCGICAELIHRSLDAITAHAEARTLIAEAVISGAPNIEALAEIVSDLRLKKDHAMEQYASHMLTHEREQTGKGAEYP